MRNLSRYFLSVLSLLMFGSVNLFSQNPNTVITSNTDPQTGIRVTTKVTPFPTLTEQVEDIEKKLSVAEKNPDMVNNGTVEKYRLVLVRLRKDLADETAERKRIEAAGQ